MGYEVYVPVNLEKDTLDDQIKTFWFHRYEYDRRSKIHARYNGLIASARVKIVAAELGFGRGHVACMDRVAEKYEARRTERADRFICWPTRGRGWS